VKLPRNISPAAEARRTWLLDVTLGILIGLLAILLAAGIGVVAFFALLAAIGLALSYLIGVGMRLRRRRELRKRDSY
jgi:hypothetical protein